MRLFLIVCSLVASQPLLLFAGLLAKWVIACCDGACAGAVYDASPFTSPRDLVLTAFAVTAPYLLAVLVAAATWRLASWLSTQPARGHWAPISELSGVTR